jgi:hypothetical protein
MNKTRNLSFAQKPSTATFMYTHIIPCPPTDFHQLLMVYRGADRNNITGQSNRQRWKTSFNKWVKT